MNWAPTAYDRWCLVKIIIGPWWVVCYPDPPLGLSVKERREHVKPSEERYSATVVHLHRKLFGVFPLLCLLTPGVEPAETVFKSVQIMQITLGFICIYSCMLYHAHGSGFRATEQGDRKG